MERVEVNRLLKMGVLKELGAESSVEGLMKLKSRFVFDWRYRQVWVRRARLVAKEFRHLAPALDDLYAPASVAVMQKLLACLCASGNQLVLFSADISDAYLRVKQSRPTFIETSSGVQYQLLYNLPGQRSGAKDWFLHLKGELAKDGMMPFVGAPTLFYEVKKSCVFSSCG